MELMHKESSLQKEIKELERFAQNLKDNFSFLSTIPKEKYQNLFFYCAGSGFLPQTQLLYENVTFPSETHQRALAVALLRGKYEIAYFLKEKKVDLTNKNKNELLAMLCNATNPFQSISYSESIKWLQDNDPFIIDDFFRDLYQQASQKTSDWFKQENNSAQFERYVQKYPYIANRKFLNCSSLLGFFSKHGLLSAIQIILPHISSINEKSFDPTFCDNCSGFNSALYFALFNNNFKIADFLVNHGAQLEETEKILLLTDNKNIHITNFILNDASDTLLKKVLFSNSLLINQLKFLMSFGLPIASKNDKGKTLLHFIHATKKRLNGEKDSLKKYIFFITNGADINALDNTGNTFLHPFCNDTNPFLSIEILKYLLYEGAPKNKRNNNNETAHDIIYVYEPEEDPKYHVITTQMKEILKSNEKPILPESARNIMLKMARKAMASKKTNITRQLINREFGKK